MTTTRLLLSAWDWEPSVIAGCIALAIGYFAIGGRWASRKTVWFLSGVLLLLLDVVSPIDTLGDTYLFSAHVLQHFLLALVIPVLLILGLPSRFASGLFEWRLIRGVERTLASPPIAWLLGVGAMVAWHVPALFNAALSNEGMHIAQHVSFLVTGTIFWWPVFGPIESRRLRPLPAVVYLFTACTACSLLGAILTFSPPGAYPAYLNPADRLGALGLIRGVWGLDPASDQHLGGLLMWVPGCLVYLAAILATFARWHGAPEFAVSDYGAAEQRSK